MVIYKASLNSANILEFLSLTPNFSFKFKVSLKSPKHNYGIKRTLASLLSNI